MGFFDDVDDSSIVEDHISNVLDLEDVEARKLMRAYSEVRKDLLEKVRKAKAGTFTAQQLRGTLAQVDGALTAMEKILSGDMKEAALKTAMEGVGDLTKEIERFSKMFTGAVVPIRLNSAVIAQDTNKFLINKYESSIESYSQGVRQAVTHGLTNAMIEQAPLSEVHTRLDDYFKGEEWKLDRIARTELHNVYNLGKLKGMEKTQDEYIPDLMKTLYQPLDSRTGKDSRYAAKLNMIVPLDEPFTYKWNGKVRSFMTPPDRPNDRSVMIPYSPNWAKP